MRRLLAGSMASIAFTGVFLILPVYADPVPEPVPVETTSESVDLGSAEAPAPAAEVQEGTTEPVAGVSDTAPVLTVSRTDVDEFSLVGVTWAYDPAVTDVRVQVRVQDAAGEWGEWTEVGTEDAGPDPADAPADETVRGGTAPLWTGPSTGVEVELATRSGAAPTDVQLDLIASDESAADSALGAPDIRDTADAAMSMPDVYSRAQWGADERIRTWAPEYASTIKAATLHHTADSNNYTADQVPQILRNIYAYHAQSLGWGDIGYNVIVDKFGRLWEGRSGGLASTVIGAHAGGFNTGTFGVSMLGNYDIAETTQPMVDSVAAIIAWKLSLYGVDPFGTTTLVSSGGGTSKYARGVAVTLPTIFGHRDVGATACPGRYGYARLGEIRNRAAQLIRQSGNTPEITQRYTADASLRATLGAPTGSEQRAAGVSWQTYQRGALFYAPGIGVKMLHGGVLAGYLGAGGPAALGAPTVEERPLPDGRGVRAEFQGGFVYWTEGTGAHVVRGAIAGYWFGQGAEGGSLGYPVADEQAIAGGAVSRFERGAIYWSAATGAHTVRGGVLGAYEAADAARGPLLFPMGEEMDAPGGLGRVQQFQSGSVYWSATTGGFPVRGGIAGAWAAAGGTEGLLGYPVTAELSTPGAAGRVQWFQGGGVVWSAATEGHVVRGGVLNAWTAAGGAAGVAGFPTSGEVPASGGGVVQNFQSGSVYWSSGTGAHLVRGGVAGTWLAAGGVSGALGYPTSGEEDTPRTAGRVQRFQGGTVYWFDARGYVLPADVAAAYLAAGGPAGVVGRPTGAAVATGPGGVGLVQPFQSGSVYWSSGTGAHVVRGGVAGAWAAAGGTGGVLGYPVTDEQDTPGSAGRVQWFQGGSVFWSEATGAHVVRGGVLGAWTAAGGVAGPAGFPTSGEAPAAGGGVVQTFQSGSVYWSSGTGAYLVRGGIGGAWQGAGGVSGRLGYPTSAEQGTATGAQQQFQGGTITWTTATARATVSYR